MSGFVASKGLVMIATGYENGEYKYTKLDPYLAASDGASITPGRAQDLDSYVNANGYLKRNVLKHMRDGVSVNTKYMSYAEMRRFVSLLKKAMKQPKCAELPEKKVRLAYFNEWTDDYDHGFFYIPDVTWQYGGTYKGEPHYQPVTLEFIEY